MNIGGYPMFPETHVHPWWLTELFILVMSACVVLVLTLSWGASLYYQVDQEVDQAHTRPDTDWARRRRQLMRRESYAILALLAAAGVIWVFRLSNYTNDSFDIGYWTQQIYKSDVVLGVINHLAITGLITGLAVAIRMRRDKWTRKKRLR